MKKFILLAAILVSTSVILGTRLPAVLMQASTHEYPTDFPDQSLDQAIHNETVHEGDTIYVLASEVAYYEHLNVNKSILLKGGVYGSTILDGGGVGTVVTISAGNVTLRGFIIRNGDSCIEILGEGDNSLINNTVISGTGNGILIKHSGNNVLRNNTLVGTGAAARNFGVIGNALQDFIQDVDPFNTVNGNPIYYCVNKTGVTISTSAAGYVAVVNSTNITVKNLNIGHNYQGILLACTTNSIIDNNTLSYDTAGIDLYSSKYSQIRCNTLTRNGIGLRLESCENNTIVYNEIEENYCGIARIGSSNLTIYRNNFVQNNQQEGLPINSTDIFDNGLEGNYWDDYNGQGGKDTDDDGIGETKLPFYFDNNPLIEKWRNTRTPGVIRYGTAAYTFTTLSNSTIAYPNWNRTLRQISFKLTSGTSESMNVTISRNWLEGPFRIKLNYSDISLEPILSLYYDENNTYIYFEYSPGACVVEVVGTRVVGNLNGDTNNDGVVDIFDAIRLSGSYGEVDG